MSEPAIGMLVTDGEDRFRCGSGCSIDRLHNLTLFPIVTSRLGRINQGTNMTRTLQVFEADLSDFHLDKPSRTVWPDSAPRIDGVLVCYDSSSLDSFTHIERLVCATRFACPLRIP